MSDMLLVLLGLMVALEPLSMEEELEVVEAEIVPVGPSFA
jgi:hypothetical protein